MPRRYRVETLTRLYDEWHAEHHTDSLAVAEGYITMLIRTHRIRSGRVVDQETGAVISQKPDPGR